MHSRPKIVQLRLIDRIENSIIIACGYLLLTPKDIFDEENKNLFYLPHS